MERQRTQRVPGRFLLGLESTKAAGYCEEKPVEDSDLRATEGKATTVF